MTVTLQGRLSPAERESLLRAFKSSIKDETGSSDYATVFCFPHNDKKYAIKQISPTSDENRLRWMEREGVIGPLLHHPNIVAHHGRVENNYFIMDYAEEEDLNDLCQLFHFSIKDIDQDDRPRRWNNTKLLMQQVRGALAYLHDNHYLYRDLKGENIRVVINKGKLEKAVLIDLGSVRHADTDDGLPPSENSQPRERSYTFCGTLATLSPEMLKRDGRYTAKTDCWSLGALLHFLLLEEYPFENAEELEQKIMHETLELPDWVPDQAKDLITRLLDKQPETRPSLQEIAEHPFFTSPI